MKKLKLKYKDLEDLVFRLQLTHHEIVDILDVKFIAGSTRGYTPAPVIYKINDINFILKSLFPKQVKINFTIDDVRLK